MKTIGAIEVKKRFLKENDDESSARAKGKSGENFFLCFFFQDFKGDLRLIQRSKTKDNRSKIEIEQQLLLAFSSLISTSMILVVIKKIKRQVVS